MFGSQTSIPNQWLEIDSGFNNHYIMKNMHSEKTIEETAECMHMHAVPHLSPGWAKQSCETFNGYATNNSSIFCRCSWMTVLYTFLHPISPNLDIYCDSAIHHKQLRMYNNCGFVRILFSHWFRKSKIRQRQNPFKTSRRLKLCFVAYNDSTEKQWPYEARMYLPHSLVVHNPAIATPLYKKLSTSQTDDVVWMV